MGPFFSGYKTHVYDLRHFSKHHQLTKEGVARSNNPSEREAKTPSTIDDDSSWVPCILALDEQLSRGLSNQRDGTVVVEKMGVGVTGYALPHGSLDFSCGGTSRREVNPPRGPTEGLRIAIIGAGIAGLVAALKLRRNGHVVTLLEKDCFRKRRDTGIAVLLGPDAFSSLCELGCELQAAGANRCEGVLSMNGITGATIWRKGFEPVGQKYEDWRSEERFWHICHRIDLRNELKRLVLDPKGEGEPAILHLGITVKYVDVHTGTVRLGDGRAFHSDLVIGADGMNSTCRKYVQPGANLTFSAKGCYRFMVPRETLLRDPETAALVEKSGCICEVTDKDRRMVLSPCRKNTMVSAVVFVPEEKSPKATRADAWKCQKGKHDMEEAFQGLCGPARKVLRYARGDLEYWPLHDMQVLNRRHNKKLVLVGDAAQSLLSYPGQGATQAIEDSMSLATLLQVGTKTDQLENRLKLYGGLRRRHIEDAPM